MPHLAGRRWIGLEASEDTGAVSLAVQQEIEALEADGSIPPGVDVVLAGVTQQQNEAFGGLSNMAAGYPLAAVGVELDAISAVVSAVSAW